MANPGTSKKKKNTLRDKLAKFADRNPYEYTKAANESKKFIRPSRAEKNDKTEKLWSEFKELHTRVQKHNKRIQDGKPVPADSDFSYKEIHKEMSRCIDSIIELDPNNYEAQKNRATLYEDEKEEDKALKCVEKITNYLKPDDVDAWFERANLLQILRRDKEALDCLDKILKIKPEIERDVLNNKGIILGQSGDGEGALECFELALTKPGTLEHYKIWTNKGTAFSGMDEHAKSIECYEKALELKPDDQFALYNKAVSLFFLNGEYQTLVKAVEFFDKAMTAVGKHLTNHVNQLNFMVMIALKKGETLFGLYLLDRRSKQKIKDADQRIQSTLAMFDYGLETIADITHFADMITTHPDFTSLLMGKGLATQFLEVGIQDRVDVMNVALACYAEVLELEPEWGNAWYQMASVVLELAVLRTAYSGQWEKASLCLKKALEFPDTLNIKQIALCKAFGKTRDTTKPEDFIQQFNKTMEKLKEEHPDSDNDPADK